MARAWQSVSEAGESGLLGKQQMWPLEEIAAVWGAGSLGWTTDVATCVNSRVTGAKISQNPMGPASSERMLVRPFIVYSLISLFCDDPLGTRNRDIYIVISPTDSAEIYNFCLQVLIQTSADQHSFLRG